MQTFEIQTGGHSYRVKATNHQEAAIKALRDHRPKKIGFLICIVGEDGIEHYQNAAHLAQLAGITTSNEQ